MKPLFPSLNAMQSKRVVPLALSIVLGLSGVYLMNQVLRTERKKLEAEKAKLYKDYRNPFQVIVAAKDIPEGTVLAQEHLGLLPVPEKFLQPYATQNPTQLVGKVTKVPFAEKEQILLNKIRSPDERPKGSNLSDITPEGKRAVTIVVDPTTGVGGFVRPGDKVDMLWTFKLGGAPDKGGKAQDELVTLTLFQDVLVMAVNAQMMGLRPPGATADTVPSRESTVTLALTPNEAALVLFAREQGRLQLALRPPKDAGQQVAVQPANLAALMETVLGPQGPAPAPSDTRTVEVYRGLQRDVMSVENR